jgi:spore germination cell wall hydrolase CwlJ-like protein
MLLLESIVTPLLAVLLSTPHMDSEVFCMAENVYHEARGEPLDGQLAVNAVVLNRSERRYMSPCDVVWEPSQFSWTIGDTPEIDLTSVEWYIALAVVAYSIENHSEYDYSHGAMFYYNPNKVDPSWAADMAVTVEIGEHKFLVN